GFRTRLQYDRCLYRAFAQETAKGRHRDGAWPRLPHGWGSGVRRAPGGLLKSLRGRLLAGTMTWILVSVLVAGWALSDLFRQHITRQLAAELAGHMSQLVAALSVDEQGTATLDFDLSDPRLHQPYSGLYWQIDRLEADGGFTEALFHSRSLWDQTLRAPSGLIRVRDDDLTPLSGPGNSTMLGLLRVI